MIITADIVAADTVPGSLSRPVGMATEGEGDSLGVTRKQFFHPSITAERFPKEIIDRQRRLLFRKTNTAHRRMMRHDNDALDLCQRLAQMQGERVHNAGSETRIVEGPANEVDVVMPTTRELFAV